LPELGKGTEIIRFITSQVSSEMKNAIVPTPFSAFAARFQGIKVIFATIAIIVESAWKSSFYQQSAAVCEAFHSSSSSHAQLSLRKNKEKGLMPSSLTLLKEPFLFGL